MAITRTRAARTFLVKSGVVFTGRVKSETKTAITLDLGGRKGVVTLAKSYIVKMDGTPYPPKIASAKPRQTSQPLVLTRPQASYPLDVILAFESPVPGATRHELAAQIPMPLRFRAEWLTPQVLSARSHSYLELDVRIAYNGKARALFGKKNITPFEDRRYDILVSAGIDAEPSDAEMRAFVRDIAKLLASARETKRLSFAYVSHTEGYGALERNAKAHTLRARRAAIGWLMAAWSADDAARKERGFLASTFTVLAAIAYERLSLDEEERAVLKTLFDRIADANDLDPDWKKLRASLVAKPRK